MLAKKSVHLLWISVALLLGMYLFPMWQITLEAPQYPEGIGMHIWLDKVTGKSQHDLHNINLLNHYIGMKSIEPDSIAELKFMKYIVAGLVVLLLVAMWLGRRWALAVWVAVAIVCSLLGLYDFYAWGYDYGHNLNPDAPIQVPGMSYQPPLIGSKKLLNITSYSYPHLAGIFFGLAILLAAVICIQHWYAERKNKLGAAGAVLLPLLLLLASCDPKPEPIEYGKDACEQCRMIIADERFGAELVTAKGKIYKYDSLECMVAHAAGMADKDIHSLWTVDFAHPRVLLPALQTLYLHAPKLPSPMGLNVSSFASADDMRVVQEKYQGRQIDWDEVKFLTAAWLAKNAGQGCKCCEQKEQP